MMQRTTLHRGRGLLHCLQQRKEHVLSCCLSLSGPKEALLDQQRAADVTTAAQWINEPLSSMLKGSNPCQQSEVDHMLSNFFMVRYLEDKDIQNKEKEELGPPSEPEVVPSSPLPAPSKDKKSVDKGKKSATAEKPFPPAEPPEAVLPGSRAVGSVSLAVARTGAQIQGVPLYRYIAALKNREDPTQLHIPVPLITLLSCGRTSTGKLSLLEEVILIPRAGQRVKQIITKTLELQKEMMRIMNTSTKHGAQAVLCDSGVLAVSYERPEQPLDLITEACSNSGLALGTEVQLALNCAAPELMDYTKGKYEIATGVLKTPDELVDMYQTLVSKYPAVVALIDPLRREAVGLGLDFVKLGGLSGAERMTKYNRLISIEEELSQQGILASKEKHPPPLFRERAVLNTDTASVVHD
ncbi:hypothetical protein KUCAC02_023771 [Chaenocephalus aceratus]|uniref:Uncharacterized protein n=1 Tax=Chaenocephalus aceratus TaxID=36190 RepID=A0ACB9WGM3_CHAAC|nr:hypothetical protein KUCAC02_023771 [Chaenocephalus aceratus]